MRKRSGALVLALSLTLGAAGTGAAEAGAYGRQGKAEIFAATTAAETAKDPYLIRFAYQGSKIIRRGGAKPRGSTLLDGVYWSSKQQQVTQERSREFHVDRVDRRKLHAIANTLRKRYHQESVLTFERLPRRSSRVDAIEVVVPGVKVKDVHDLLLADPVLRDRLGGGSVTLNNRLIQIAGVGDLPLVRQFVTKLGANWKKATVRYGAWEFVYN